MIRQRAAPRRAPAKAPTPQTGRPHERGRGGSDPSLNSGPLAEPRAGAAPAKHLRPSLFAALAAPVRKLWPRETDLGRIGMAIAAPVLCWVFYTTSSGMVDIMQKEPGDWIGLGGAVIATTAILVMLASTSWSLGADLASLIAMRRMARERVIIKTSITALVFAFVFSISAFFSFTYYYNNIFKLSSKKIVGELQPMELAADIVLPTAKEVAARYDENTAHLEATPGFKSYLDQLEALSETARTADATLRESIRKSQEARQRVALEAARRAAADLAEAQRQAGSSTTQRRGYSNWSAAPPISTRSSRPSRKKSPAWRRPRNRKSRPPSTPPRGSMGSEPPAVPTASRIAPNRWRRKSASRRSGRRSRGRSPSAPTPCADATRWTPRRSP